MVKNVIFCPWLFLLPPSLSLSRNTTALGPHHHFSLGRHCCAWLTQACSPPLPARVACSACLPHSPPAAARRAARVTGCACTPLATTAGCSSSCAVRRRLPTAHLAATTDMPRPHHCLLHTRKRKRAGGKRKKRKGREEEERAKGKLSLLSSW